MRSYSKLLAAIMIAILMGTVAAAQSANVWVIHGIPGKDLNANPRLPVDVAVNGKCTLQGFTFGKIAGPLSLPPATYKIEISAANTQNPCSNPALITANVPIAVGEDVVIIAHLDAAGKATASKFNIDLSRTKFLRTRLTAHHTAWAPAVDVRLKGLFWNRNRSKSLDGVTNGQQGSVDLRVGLWGLGVFPANSQTPVLGPLYGPAIPGYVYLTFVVGSLQNNTLRPLIYIMKSRRS